MTPRAFFFLSLLHNGSHVVTEPTTTGFYAAAPLYEAPPLTIQPDRRLSAVNFPGQPYYPNDEARLAPARVGHRIAWDPTFLASCASWKSQQPAQEL